MVLTAEQVNALLHVLKHHKLHGRHSFMSCPPGSRAMCPFVNVILSCTKSLEEL